MGCGRIGIGGGHATHFATDTWAALGGVGRGLSLRATAGVGRWSSLRATAQRFSAGASLLVSCGPPGRPPTSLMGGARILPVKVMVLAILVGGLIVGGALVSGAFTKWLSKEHDRRVILMASVTSWFVLVGMVPFFVFALFVNRVGSGGRVSSFASFLLNLVPFALVGSPIIGFVQGLRLSAGSQEGPPS